MAAPSSPTPDRAVGLWLLSCCGMIAVMALLGAITRLTESGLSIMEWAPIKGALPPMSRAEWERLFALYQTIPEYQQMNQGMELAGFQQIFWWEYLHRLWGRLIGLVFGLPFAWFLLKRRLSPRTARALWLALGLGGLQGFAGWYMVSSGFADRTDVSQYRLVLHLGLALLLYGLLLWLALGLLRPRLEVAPARRPLQAMLGLVALTLASGGLVAGLNAGFFYNTFPTMNGAWIPPDYGRIQPWFLDPFENPAAAQLHHRLLGLATAAAAVGLWAWARRNPAHPSLGALRLLAGLALLQVTLGIAALLLHVPPTLGAAHQAGAIAVFSAAIAALGLGHRPGQSRGP